MKCLLLLLVAVGMVTAKAENKSKYDLFKKLGRAGFSQIIEFPFSNSMVHGFVKIYSVSNNEDKIYKDNLTGYKIEDHVPVKQLDYSTGRRHSIKKAFQINNMLVCYKTAKQRALGAHVFWDVHSKYSHCLIFPNAIDEVVKAMEEAVINIKH